jgi:hypothetical protein
MLNRMLQVTLLAGLNLLCVVGLNGTSVARVALEALVYVASKSCDILRESLFNSNATL